MIKRIDDVIFQVNSLDNMAIYLRSLLYSKGANALAEQVRVIGIDAENRTLRTPSDISFTSDGRCWHARQALKDVDYSPVEIETFTPNNNSTCNVIISDGSIAYINDDFLFDTKEECQKACDKLNAERQ